MVANAWLEGTYSEIYSHVGNDEQGMAELFRQFSYPGGIPSHAAPETPGSINEGGELGYSLAHAYGSVFDNPELVTAVVIGDGEAETGPLAASWHSHNFLDPVADGAVLPILHLNGYKIANPTVLARMPEAQLEQLLRGYGHEPHFVTVADPDDIAAAHRDFAAALDRCLAEIRAIQADRRGTAETGGARSGHGRRGGRCSCCARPRAGPARGPWTGCRWRGPGEATRSPSPKSGPTPGTWTSSDNGSSPTGRRNCSTRTAGSGPTPPRTPPAAGCG